MTASARDVATAVRQRLPGVATLKLHKLLYYCQGHHLATFGRPLFDERVSAWDHGPVVGQLWYEEKNGVQEPSCRELTEAELNTVGYVISRYGALSGRDLETLSHHQMPWQRADVEREPGQSAPIEPEWLTEFFRAEGAAEAAEGLTLGPAAVTDWLRETGPRPTGPGRRDSLDELHGRLLQNG